MRRLYDCYGNALESEDLVSRRDYDYLASRLANSEESTRMIGTAYNKLNKRYAEAVWLLREWNTYRPDCNRDQTPHEATTAFLLNVNR